MRILSLILLSAALLGCFDSTPQPEQQFDHYLARIANVQESAQLASPERSYPSLPSKRELKIDIPSITLGLLESYELRHCQLFELIAQRNSSLGKVQDQFRNYQYQNQLIRGLNRCLAHPEISPSLKTKLSDILAQKRQQHVLHLSNLLFISDTMRSQLVSYQWIDQGMYDHANQVIQALSVISSTVTGSNSNERSIVTTQQTLETVPLLGSLSYSLINASQWLKVINQQLYSNDTKITCGAQRDTTKLTYLRNVFDKFYVRQIQPYLAQLDQLYFRLQPSIQILSTTHPNYQYPLAQQHQRFHRQSERHANYWQQLFKRCGIRIGQ